MSQQEHDSVLDWTARVDEEVAYTSSEPRLKIVYWTRVGERVDGGEARAIAIYHAGLGECVARYRHVADELLSRCESLDAFVSFDIRGHGASEGGRGAIADIEELEEDFVSRVLPEVANKVGPKPRVLLMGQYVCAAAKDANAC